MSVADAAAPHLVGVRECGPHTTCRTDQGISPTGAGSRIAAGQGGDAARRFLPSTAPLPVDVPMPVPSSGSGRGRGKPPLPARMSPVVIVGVVLAAAAFLSLPSLLALAQQASVFPPTPAGPRCRRRSLRSLRSRRPSAPSTRTRTLAAWTGTATATGALGDATADQLRLSVVLPDGSPVGSTAVVVPPLKSGPNELGEIEVVVHGAPAAVSCRATLAYSTTR